jgi:hypothetical protein
MEQRRRLFFPGRRVCFVLSAFRLKRSLSLSSSLGSTRIALPSSSAAGRSPRCFAFVPVWVIAVFARSRPGRAARSAPPRRRYVRSSLLTITPHRDRTDKHSLYTNCESTVRRLASRRDERHALAGAPLTRRHERRSRHTMLFLRDTRARHGTALREHKALHSTLHIGT